MSALDERFEILRRILDRAQGYSEAKENSGMIDYIEHLRNELNLLRYEVERHVNTV